MATQAYDCVPVVELDRAPLRTTISPLPTAFTLIRDALQGGRRGTPARWRRQVLSGLRRRDAAAFAPLVDPESTGWPSILESVDVHATRETLDVALERVAATPGTALLAALEHEHDVTLTPAWNAARRNPDRWLRGYVDALHRGWRRLEPLWRGSAGLLEREEEKVIAAMYRGVSPAQLAQALFPRSPLVGSVLRLAPAGHQSRCLRVGERGVTVIPIVASAKAGTMSAPGDFLEWVAYPIPEVWRAFDDQAPPPASLHALLGAQRSALLGRLDDPQSAGQLAQLVGLTPSAVTFHLRALEAAGLIWRQRCGRNVVVHRTARGTQLLVLYELP
jgi:DNA-binding transcriptional ArsR family regulator